MIWSPAILQWNRRTSVLLQPPSSRCSAVLKLNFDVMTSCQTTKLNLYAVWFFFSPHAARVMPLTLLAIALFIAFFSVCNVEVWRERRFLICLDHGGCWNGMRSVCTSLLPSLISLVLCCPTCARRNVWKRWIMAQLKPDHKDWSGCSV